jgi:hypothetical protein
MFKTLNLCIIVIHHNKYNLKNFYKKNHIYVSDKNKNNENKCILIIYQRVY